MHTCRSRVPRRARRPVSSRHEDAVGHARVQMHVVGERRVAAVQEGDATGPRTGSSRRVGVIRQACCSAEEPLRAAQPLDLVKKDLRSIRDWVQPGFSWAERSTATAQGDLIYGLDGFCGAGATRPLCVRG